MCKEKFEIKKQTNKGNNYFASFIIILIKFIKYY